MCVKVISNFSFDFRNSYCVTKAILKCFKMPCLQNNRLICSVMGHVPKILPRKLSTRMEIETDSNKKSTGEYSDDRETLETSKPKIRRRQSVSPEIIKYMDSNASLKSLLEILPKKVLRRKKGTPEALYVVDKDVAKTITKEVRHATNIKGVAVFEINPGPGVLSQELLTSGVGDLRLCEPSNSFLQQMQDLQSKFPAQVQVIKQDLLSLAKLEFLDRQDGGMRIQNMFSGITKVEWSDDPVMVIVGILPSFMFIRHLIKCHIFQTGILTYGRPELYVVLSPNHYFYLTCGKEAGYFNYRSISVLFQLIFDWSLVRKLPREAFLPWEVKYFPKKWSKLAKVQSIDPDRMYLVKIVPRRDFFEKVAKVDQLQALWYFVWHHMVSRKNKIIPQLEKWIPQCGPRLIAKDMTIYTEFGDLTPQEILSVFHEFVSWPEYPDCPFMSSIEGVLMKMEQSSDEIVKIEEDDDVDDVDDDEHDSN